MSKIAKFAKGITGKFRKTPASSPAYKEEVPDVPGENLEDEEIENIEEVDEDTLLNKQNTSKKGLSRGSKIGIGAIVIGFVVVVIIILVVLWATGVFSSTNTQSSSNTSNTCTSDKELVNGICLLKCANGQTRNSAGLCVAPCSSSQELVSGQCVPKCTNNMVRLGNRTCGCPQGLSGSNCEIVESINGTAITPENGYSMCTSSSGFNILWNGYECINLDHISKCPLSGNITCSNYGNVYYLHDTNATDPYQCYNGTETSGGRVFGESGSYAEPTDRCMFGVGGATSLTACNALKTALKC